MSQILKTFTGVFFLLLLVFLGTGILTAQMDVSTAISCKADTITKLENSNYNADVLNACIADAIRQGYEIEIVTYTEGRRIVRYQTPTASDTADVVMAEVRLTYPYRIAFLNSVTKHQIRGYAR